MLGSLKKLFFKDTGEDLATSIPEPVAIASTPNWSAIPANPATPVSAPETAAPTSFVPADATSSEMLSLPLQAIFARLPNSLAPVVQSQGNGFICLPAKRIALELPKGSVKIPFGELRRATPAGTFFDNARHDQVLVELPLEEILARLHPSLLARRPDQKQIEVSPEITNVFGPHGEGISLSTTPMNASKPLAPRSTGDTTALKRGDTSTTHRGDTSTARRSDTSLSRRTDTSLTRRSDTSLFGRNVDAPTLHSSPTAAVPLSVPVEPDPIAEGEPVVVPLALLCEGWPEMVRVEIRELNLANAPVSFPLDELGRSLRAGKIIFTWKQVCGWMQPPVASVSGAQDAQVELPLKIIAPLFMAKYRAANVQQKVSVAEIPDLFAKKPSETEASMPAPQPVAPVKPTPANAPIAFVAPAAPSITPVAPKMAPAAPKVAPVAPAPVQPKLVMKPDNITPIPTLTETKPALTVEPKPVAAQEKAVAAQPKSIGEIFNQPAKNNWPPAEVLKHVVTLPGIAGAFLAMQDGLLIAAELPAQFKAETVAAFLPQIFGRMNQYTKELQLGGLSSLTFVINDVSWQVIKSGAVYLVALGKSGENLPGTNLNIIAAELGKQMQ